MRAFFDRLANEAGLLADEAGECADTAMIGRGVRPNVAVTGTKPPRHVRRGVHQ
jgi:hypothetical protein